MILLFLIIGFILLLKGADFLIEGATNLAERMHISPLVIGLTIVAIGTSLPELIVSIIANLEGNTDLILGNIFGSNLANTLLILGAAALIQPVIIKKHIAWIDIPIYVGVSMILFAMMNNHIFTQGKLAQLTAVEGFLMLLIFLGYMYLSYHEQKVEKKEKEKQGKFLWKKITTIVARFHGFLKNQAEREIAKKVLKDIILMLLGVVGLFIGGKLVVENAVAIALSLGMSESLVGLTIVAVGTSLPELVTTIIAARKNNADIAVGNIVGSNIINIVLILGVTMITGKIGITMENNIDFLIMFLTALVFWLFIYIGKKYTLQRWQGLLFLFMYCSYILYRSLT